MTETAIQTWTPISQMLLPALGPALLATWKSNGHRSDHELRPEGVLASTLLAGCTDEGSVASAINADLNLTFGVATTNVRILAHTGLQVVVAFDATAVCRGHASYSAGGDPIWCLFPWGPDRIWVRYALAELNEGVTAMINGQWQAAVRKLQDATRNLGGWDDYREANLVYRALAANIAWAVAASYGS